VSLVEAFRKGLRQVGLIENQNIVLDIVWSGNDPDQAVKEVLGRGAELLITSGSSTSVAAKRQTSTIPIVFLHVGDPVAVGLIESLSRPGQNATGFSDILAELSGRLVDLAKELNKSQSSVSYLWYTDWPDGQHRYALTREAAEKIGLEVRANPITNIAQLNDVLNDKAAWVDGVYRSAKPIHLCRTRANHCSSDQIWVRDDICVPGCCEGGLIGCLRSRLPAHL